VHVLGLIVLRCDPALNVIELALDQTVYFLYHNDCYMAFLVVHDNAMLWSRDDSTDDPSDHDESMDASDEGAE
jgi:hypothetical protein